MMTSAIGAEPMWWAAGHHPVIPDVKTSKARSGGAGTAIDRRIDSTAWIIGLLGDGLLEGRERALPHLVEVGAQDRQAGRVDLVEPAGGRPCDEPQPAVPEHPEVV